MNEKPMAVVNKLRPLLTTLIKNFSTGDYDKRKESAIALSKFKGEKATDFLLARYESDNIQDFMALALGNIENEKAVSLLMTALNDSQQEVRFSAAQALGMIKSNEAFNVLMEALSEYADANLSGSSPAPSSSQIFFEEDTIISAIIALGNIQNNLGVPILKRLLAQEKSPRIRASIITALGMMATVRMLPIFQSALRDEDSRVRANAIEAIESIKSSSIVGIIQPYLDDASNRVRANVAKAIWKFGDFNVSATLDEMLHHPDKWYRASAAYAIGEIHDARFISKLALALKDEDPNVRRNATNALRRIESEEALPSLIPLLDDPNFDVRVQAALAIARCDKTGACEKLVAKLEQEQNSIVKATLISCLGDIGDKKMVGVIMPFLNDEDARVVSNAIDVLHKLSPDKPAAALMKKLQTLLSHDDNRVKSNAVKTLWHWKDLTALDNLNSMLKDSNPRSWQSATFVLGEIGVAVSQDEALTEAVNTVIAELIDSPSTMIEAELDIQTEESPQKPPEEAVQVKEKAENFDREIELAGYAVVAKEFDSAESLYLKVLEAQPENLKAILGAGNLYFIKRDFTNATTFFEKALKLNPNLVKAHYNLGTIYFFKKNYRRSQDHLLMALKLYPKLLGAYLILAQIFQAAGKADETIQLLTKAIDLSPRNPILYQKLAMFHLHLKHYQEASMVLEKAVLLSPYDVQSFVLLAFCYKHLGMTEKSLAAFEQTLQSCTQSPNPDESLKALIQGYVFFKSGSIEQQ